MNTPVTDRNLLRMRELSKPRWVREGAKKKKPARRKEIASTCAV
jgi:hypothetical protein